MSATTCSKTGAPVASKKLNVDDLLEPDYHDVDVPMVKNVLQEQGKDSADVNFILRWAARHGRLDILEFLLRQGVDINGEESDSRSYGHSYALGEAVKEAVLTGRMETFNFLIENGADVQVRDYSYESRSLLHVAFATYHSAVTNLEICPISYHKNLQLGPILLHRLLELGLDIESTDDVGRTVLHEASYRGSEKVVSWLLSKGANVNSEDIFRDTPLDMACWGKKIDVAKLLLSHGGTSNPEDRGHNALSGAAINGDLSMLTLLLDNTAVRAENLPNPRPVLLCAVQSGVSDAVTLLLQRGFHIQGSASLLAAVKEEPAERVAMLLQLGTDINGTNSNHQNALHLAVLCAREWGRKSFTMLHRQDEIVRMLIIAGVDPDVQDLNGKTPLDLAREGRYRKGVVLLTNVKQARPRL